MPPRSIRFAALLCGAVLTVTGCTDATSQGSPDRTPSSPGPTTATPPPEPDPPTPEPAPGPGRCYPLTEQNLAGASDDTAPVRCRDEHSSQTYHVGVIPARVVGETEDLDAEAVAAYVTPRCDRRFATWIGGTPARRLLSRLQATWFLPSTEGLSLGADWFRCDVVSYGRDDRLSALPTTTRGLLAGEDALDTYGLCSQGSPEDSDSTPVSCDRRHDWRAFEVQELRPGGRGAYPPRSVLRAARGECSVSVRERLGFPLEWTYGWQPPTQAAWDDGLDHGFCWAPG